MQYDNLYFIDFYVFCTTYALTQKKNNDWLEFSGFIALH
jgi:hypothetical protein